MRLTHFMICIPGIRALRLDSTGKLSRWLVTEHLQQFYLGPNFVIRAADQYR